MDKQTKLVQTSIIQNLIYEITDLQFLHVMSYTETFYDKNKIT